MLPRLLGSLALAVPLLVAIALVLAWGTIYETRFGTAAVQRFVYQAWWFQALLGFLALNLAMSALERYPWNRRHTPFLLAHLGIILLLAGGIIGGRFGVEGQLLIPEGQAERALQLPRNVLVVHKSNPGIHHVLPTNFESTAWVHETDHRFTVPLDGGHALRLTVDRYYPDARVQEEVTPDGPADNPAVQVRLRHGEQQDTIWLLARDPERFGVRWGDLHLLLLEPDTQEQLAQLRAPQPSASQRGSLALTLPGGTAPVIVPVPERLEDPVRLAGTPYTVQFKEYFPDFAITDEGLSSRSAEPNNPAVSFVLSGPEGQDPYLLFALHPDFPMIHGQTHTIKATAAYTHPAVAALPPDAAVLLWAPLGDGGKGTARLSAVLTGPAGERQTIDELAPGATAAHPWSGYTLEVVAVEPRARVSQEFVNQSDRVKQEAIHVVARDGAASADAWLSLRGLADLAVGDTRITVEYRPATRELPFTVKLLDFRKIDYPGTDMAAGFESDVQLTDPQRGLILMRTIKMNTPLRYRGYSLFQSSYVPGEPETTVLSVRNDPGCPLVYAGFLIVMGGIISLFVLRPRWEAV